MTKREIKAIVKKQRDFFNTGATLNVKFRKDALKKLKRIIKRRERDIYDALHQDLGKSKAEAYMCEVGMVLCELNYMIKNVSKLSAKRRVKTPAAQFKAKSYMLPSPRGVTLIMSPWNYPFLLTLEPLCEAIAAGNTVVLKPSAYSAATSALISELVTEAFAREHVTVIQGGRNENTALLDERFDFVFFTGSGAVGKEVLLHTAKTLTPAVLELGGKSPCIVDSTAKIPLAAKRIVFGKLLNCGQTCVAPDYVLCHKDVKKEFIAQLCREIHDQYGNYPLDDPDYGKIINKKHYDRLAALIDRDKLMYGGACDPESLRIAPTVLDGVSFSDPVMQEEIFGPILPVITYDELDSVIDTLRNMPSPLAFYVFTEDKAVAERLMSALPFGGGCINDVIIHLATLNMPFGGVMESGMGSYHGKYGFDTFSHIKSIVSKGTGIDLPMRYRPYTKLKLAFIKKFLH